MCWMAGMADDDGIMVDSSPHYALVPEVAELTVLEHGSETILSHSTDL